MKTALAKLRTTRWSAAGGKSRRSVTDLIVRLGEGWQVFRFDRDGVKRIALDEAGSEVVRCAPEDRVLVDLGRNRHRVREALMRELKAMPAYVRRGAQVIACPAAQRTVADRRVRPLAAAIPERVAAARNQVLPVQSGAPQRPAIATLGVGARLTVMWPVAVDGAVGPCEIVAVESKEELLEFAGTFAAAREMEGAEIIALDAAEPIEKWLPELLLPMYPMEGDLLGIPLDWYARGFAGSMGVLVAVCALHAWAGYSHLIEAERRLAQAQARLKSESLAMNRWVMNHVDVAIDDGAVDFAGLLAAARTVWQPGAKVALVKNGLIVYLQSHRTPGERAGLRGIGAAALRTALSRKAPKGWERTKVIATNGGQSYEVVYERKSALGREMGMGGGNLPPGLRRILVEHREP